MNKLWDAFRRLQQLDQVAQHSNVFIIDAGKPNDQVSARARLPFHSFWQLKY